MNQWHEHKPARFCIEGTCDHILSCGQAPKQVVIRLLRMACLDAKKVNGNNERGVGLHACVQKSGFSLAIWLGPNLHLRPFQAYRWGSNKKHCTTASILTRKRGRLPWDSEI